MEILGVKYPNLNSKIKGMYAKRITKNDLEDLIKQNNLKNAILLLKSKCDIFKRYFSKSENWKRNKMRASKSIRCHFS